MKTSEIPVFEGSTVNGQVITLVEISPGVFRLRLVDKNILGATGAKGDDGEIGPPGVRGEDGTSGSVWRDGAGAPSNGLGINGDYYLNVTNGDVYKKTSGTYAVVGNIKGSSGGGGGGGGFSLNYKFRTTHTPNPGAGEILFDADYSQGANLNLYVNKASQDDTDLLSVIFQTQSGDEIWIVSQSDPKKYILFQQTHFSNFSPPETAVYQGVINTSDFVLHPFADNESVSVVFLPQKASTFQLWYDDDTVGTATYTIDLRHGPYNALTLTGNPTFATNVTTFGDFNRAVIWKIIAGGSIRTLTFPAGWVWVGAAKPATLAANKIALLKLHVYGETDADVIAEWVLQNP